MPKIVQIFKLLFVYSILLVSIFFTLLALLDNKNTMIITIDTHSPYPVEAEFYYTTEGVGYDDQKMSRRYKIKDTHYYFRLPNLQEIQYARLDPTKRKGKHITIHKNAYLFISQWFTTSVYTIDMTKSEPGSQLKNYQITSEGIDFVSDGRDPYFYINMTRTFDHISFSPHLDTLLLALLITILIGYLFKLFQTETFNQKLANKLILYALFLAFSFFKVDYYKEHIHFNYPPDTIAHLSYIESIHTTHEILPKFENMYMITNKNAGNYLGHPPLYYYMMNLVYDKHYSVNGNVENFRNLNSMIFLSSIFLLLFIGFKTNMSLVGHFTYLTLLTSLPMHAYLGSSITNDNLAILGGIIFIVGLQRLMYKEDDTVTYLILGLGIFIAYFSKLTAALLVFFALVYYLIYLYKYKIKCTIKMKHLILLLLFILPVLLYQVHIMISYHTLVPTLNATHPDEYKHSVYFIPEAQRHYLTLIQWIQNYWSNIYSGWFGILSHHSLVKLSVFDFIGMLLLHIFAIAAFFFKCNDEEKVYCLVGKLTLFSLFTVMLVQFTFSYMAHLHSGYMGGLQTRYLLPFMVAFAIMASIFVDRFKNNYLFTLFIIAICIQAIYSDFFYFLKYYI